MTIAANIDQMLARPLPLDETKVVYDLVFVLNANYKGWILEKICNVIAAEGPYNTRIIFSERNDRITVPLPTARAYFFAHYSLYLASLQREPKVASALRFVWFTHPADGGRYTIEDIAYGIQRITMAFSACSGHAERLIQLGVEPRQIATILGGADPDLFRFKQRGKGRVAFVGAYYERKNPELMLEVIRAMPETEFLLLGPSPVEVENVGLLWANWPRFAELARLSNLKIVEAEYADYPRHFEDMDVYVSLSRLEGGPIAVIEALFANVIPVVTTTGFAVDIIADGRNGHLLEIECSLQDVVGAIERAKADTVTDVRSSSLHLSWSAFGREFWLYMFPALAPGGSIDFGDRDNCLRYCREGFGPQETKGVLVLRDLARLSFPIVVAATPPSHLTAHFRIKDALAFNQVELAARVNGVAMGCQRFICARNHNWRLDLAGVPFTEDRLDLEIAIVSPHFDADVGLLRLEGVSLA